MFTSVHIWPGFWYFGVGFLTSCQWTNVTHKCKSYWLYYLPLIADEGERTVASPFDPVKSSVANPKSPIFTCKSDPCRNMFFGWNKIGDINKLCPWYNFY